MTETTTLGGLPINYMDIVDTIIKPYVPPKKKRFLSRADLKTLTPPPPDTQEYRLYLNSKDRWGLKECSGKSIVVVAYSLKQAFFLAYNNTPFKETEGIGIICRHLTDHNVCSWCELNITDEDCESPFQHKEKWFCGDYCFDCWYQEEQLSKDEDEWN